MSACYLNIAESDIIKQAKLLGSREQQSVTSEDLS